jgi:hypothetical protein
MWDFSKLRHEEMGYAEQQTEEAKSEKLDKDFVAGFCQKWSLKVWSKVKLISGRKRLN